MCKVRELSWGIIVILRLTESMVEGSVTQRGFPVDDCASDGRGALFERSEFANTDINRRTGVHRKRSVLPIPSSITFVKEIYNMHPTKISPLHIPLRYDTIK